MLTVSSFSYLNIKKSLKWIVQAGLHSSAICSRYTAFQIYGPRFCAPKINHIGGKTVSSQFLPAAEQVYKLALSHHHHFSQRTHFLVSTWNIGFLWQVWPYVTHETKCDKCDHLWQLWPHVTSVTTCGIAHRSTTHASNWPHLGVEGRLKNWKMMNVASYIVIHGKCPFCNCSRR